jgi:hypothetical protein
MRDFEVATLAYDGSPPIIRMTRRAVPMAPTEQTGAYVDCFPGHAAFPKSQETALSTRLDPEDLHYVIGAYHKCVAETVARLGDNRNRSVRRRPCI